VKRFADRLNLPPVWWWSSVAAVAVVALIFLAVGAIVAFLVCLLCAVGIAVLALSAGPHDETKHPEESPAEPDETDPAGA
jgi:hypothetical protein